MSDTTSSSSRSRSSLYVECLCWDTLGQMDLRVQLFRRSIRSKFSRSAKDVDQVSEDSRDPSHPRVTVSFERYSPGFRAG